jgi:predicted GNAT family acetyltransferase
MASTTTARSTSSSGSALLRKRGLAPHLAAALLQEADARGEARTGATCRSASPSTTSPS